MDLDWWSGLELRLVKLRIDSSVLELTDVFVSQEFLKSEELTGPNRSFNWIFSDGPDGFDHPAAFFAITRN